MKSKLLFSIFVLSVFSLGGVGGFYAGIVGATGSNSSQLYAGAQEMRAALISLEKNDIKKAKATLCRSIETRLQILDLAKPVLHQRKKDEVSTIQQAWLYDNINESKEGFVAICT
jgi:hypothetical protein